MPPSLPEAFEAWVDDTEKRWATAVTKGVHAATLAGLNALRSQLDAAFPGSHAASLVTAELYPNPRSGKVSLDATGFVGPRRSRSEKAEQILRAWSEGVTIRSSAGFWLAIPTEHVPRDSRNRRLSPGEVEKRFGVSLRLVPAGGPRRSALLVMDDVVQARNGRGWRQATAGRLAQGRAAQGVVMFVLVPEVTLSRRLDPQAAVSAEFSRVNVSIDRALKALP